MSLSGTQVHTLPVSAPPPPPPPPSVCGTEALQSRPLPRAAGSAAQAGAWEDALLPPWSSARLQCPSVPPRQGLCSWVPQQ